MEQNIEQTGTKTTDWETKMRHVEHKFATRKDYGTKF
jgi:hypothetical protein